MAANAPQMRQNMLGKRTFDCRVMDDNHSETKDRRALTMAENFPQNEKKYKGKKNLRLKDDGR
jgi:hypothetical protein